MSTILIKQASIYNRPGQLDCLIRDGRIESIGEQCTEEADETIDAEGLTLIPGAIDVHVHFRVPGGEQKEDFTTGSIAAASGGVTTACHMPNTNPPIVTALQVGQYAAQAKLESVIDVRCYIGATTDNLDEVLAAAETACGIKVAPYFTGADGTRLIDDEEALRALFSVKQPLPIVIHCEQEELVDERAEELKEYTDWDIHGKIRPREAAVASMERIISLARETGARVHITHLSTKEELELIRAAKEEGCHITCDVTPHHLAFTEADMKGTGYFLKVNPPLRQEEDISALWDGLISGDIDMVATDHAPHTRAEKETEDYWEAPSGIPGVETMLPFLLDRISSDFPLERIVECVSTKPAQLFGFSGKGSIQEGATADLVLIDLNGTQHIRQDKIRSKCGWSPWEGQNFKGKIHTVIENGQRIQL